MFLKSSPLFLAGLHSDSSPFIKESMGSLIVSSLAVQGIWGLKNLINSNNFTEDWNECNIDIAKQYEKNPQNLYF